MPAASIKLSAELVEEARASAAIFQRSIGGQVEYWARLGQAVERAPGFTLDRIRAALDGRFDPEALSEAERLIYDDLDFERSLEPTPAGIAAGERLQTTPGATGYDDDGRLVKVRRDGTREVIG
jgi:hypothetical protein